MKVKVLGTGTTYTGFNCAGILVNNDTLFDIGPGTIKQLLKDGHRLLDIKYLVVSHLHFDHIWDFPILVCNNILNDWEHVLKIYGPKGLYAKLEDIIKAANLDSKSLMMEYLKKSCKIHVVTDGFEEEIGGNIVKAYRMDHGVVEAYGYNINHELSYTGDTGFCENVQALAENSTHLICDCSCVEGIATHMGINDLNMVAAKNPSLKIIPVHFRVGTREVLEKSNPYNFKFVKDGDSFEI